MATNLKQFDEWLNKDGCSLLKYPNWNHREVCFAEDGWKAALEWVLKINDGSFMPSRYTIEEEIGDE